MLNNSVCNGIQLKAVIRDEGTTGVASAMNIGFNISPQDQDLTTGIPLTISRKRARFFLGFFMHLRADDDKRFMMVTESMAILALDAELSKELLHYDYERDKPAQGKGYPEAHLQVCATSDHWDAAGQRVTGDELMLSKMHLPVGPQWGRRFRPSLEDVIELLVVEELVEARPQWQDALNTTRRPFQELQLKAAVRRNQELAKAALEEEGWIVTREPR